eukprot:gene3164-5480_t
MWQTLIGQIKLEVKKHSGDSKCFFEDLVVKQLVYVSYKCPICDSKTRRQLSQLTKVSPEHAVGVIVDIFDPEGTKLYHTKVDEPEGHFHFESSDETNGLHQLCFKSNLTSPFMFGKKNLFELHVEIKVDALPSELKEYTKVHQINNIGSKLGLVDNLMHHVRQDLKYSQIRQEQFRK